MLFLFPSQSDLRCGFRCGVSRVYSQQCGYVLSDVTNLRDKMRGTEAVLKQMNLDPEAGNARLVRCREPGLRSHGARSACLS